MISNKIKKEVATYWQNEFPTMSLFSENGIYCFCGPFVIGIELIKSPKVDNYRPVFVIYPLWKDTIKSCFEESIFIQEIRNSKKLQFNIPYLKNDLQLYEALECVKSQIPILLHQNILIIKLFEIIENQFSQTLIKSSPIGQAKLYEAKLMLSLFVNDLNLANHIFQEIKKISKSWIPELFEWKYGKLDVWLKNIEFRINNNYNFINQIETNKFDNKIYKFKNINLTL